MAIHFRCQCGRRYSVRDERAGRTIVCPSCGQPLTVPTLPFGERRTQERRKGPRRTGEGGWTGPNRRTGDRRRRDRRAQGGLDISDLPQFIRRPKRTTPTPRGALTAPPEAIPRPPSRPPLGPAGDDERAGGDRVRLGWVIGGFTACVIAGILAYCLL